MPSALASLEGPSFVLTADEPVAAFEVTLCLEGPTAKAAYVHASLTADARTTGDAATLRLESLADRPADEGSDSLEVSAQGQELRFSLEADGPWEDGGRRCSTPEVVEFSAEGLADGQSLEIEAWVVDMDVKWDAGAFGGGRGDSRVSYDRKKGAGNEHTEGPIAGWVGDDFVVGVMTQKTTFNVDTPPHEDAGTWTMVVNGDTMYRLAP